MKLLATTILAAAMVAVVPVALGVHGSGAAGFGKKALADCHYDGDNGIAEARTTCAKRVTVPNHGKILVRLDARSRDSDESWIRVWRVRKGERARRVLAAHNPTGPASGKVFVPPKPDRPCCRFEVRGSLWSDPGHFKIVSHARHRTRWEVRAVWDEHEPCPPKPCDGAPPEPPDPDEEGDP